MSEQAKYGRAIGRGIARARKARHWTQEDLAQLSGVPRRHISEIELGNKPHVTIGTVAMLALALGESLDDLLGRAK